MTPPSNAVFLASFPEFSEAPNDLITKKLLEASRRTNASVFADTDTANDACNLRAAILLSLSPYSRKMRLVSDEQAFVWSGQLYELQRSATTGSRVF